MSDELTQLLCSPTLDDLVAGVLANAKLEEIPSDKATIHQFFLDLRSEADIPERMKNVLDGVRFEVGDWFPFARELEAALMRLQVAGLVSAMNPDFRRYTMKKEQRQRVNERVACLTEDEQAFVARPAEKFAKRMTPAG